MGTSKCGRYLNTRGSGRGVSDFALVHSNEGKFIWRQRRVNGKVVHTLRMASGGHGQKGMDILDKHGVKYEVLKIYPNGVRIGNVIDHKDRKKREEAGQAWFPSSWTEKDIRRAGEHVAGLKRNRHLRDGEPGFGVYKGVRVGVIRTNGKIATIFPDMTQNNLRKKRGG